MPKFYNDFSDDRHKTWCIHCASPLVSSDTNRDHIPSKSLLEKPYPSQLDVIRICEPCNESFSLDEEYLVCFLSVVLSGSVDPENQFIPKAKDILRRNEVLKSRLSKSNEIYGTISGQFQAVWKPEFERIRNVLLKNAKGHLFHEMGEPQFEEPTSSVLIPDILETGKIEFLKSINASPCSIWPEVGSRWSQRLISDTNFDRSGFLIVQPDVYLYRIEVENLGVSMILRNYLYARFDWS